MRISSLSPAVTEILFALGQERNIVCTDQYSDAPDPARALPHLQGHTTVDIGALQTYSPDVVFTSTIVQAALAEELRSKGCGVIHQDPRSIGEVYESIRQIGTILGCEARAEALIGTMQQGFNDTKRKAALLARKPKVYVEEWHHPPMVSGNWVPEVIKVAGGMAFPLEPRALSREVRLAEVQAFDPDLAVLSICGAGSVARKELLTDREGWSALRAVTQNHVFVLDDSLLNRPGPRLPEGARRLFGWAFQVMHS